MLDHKQYDQVRSILSARSMVRWQDKKLIGIDYYRQTPEIRNSFDTRKQIAVLKRDGFAERSEQIRPETNITKKEKEMKINIKQK